MNKQPTRAIGLVAAGIVAGGILAGSLGAQAANQADDQRPEPVGIRADVDHRGGPGGPHRFGGPDTAELAEALGVSEGDLQKAFQAVRDDLRPDQGAKRADGPPSAARRAAMESKVAAALAKELGVSEAKVKAALAKVHEAREAEHREALSDRLDAAVKAGKLTSADKAAVLKAFDADVLGGPGPR